MAAPGARMRLAVVVEALAEENAHGAYRDLALEAFKERRFAMPVQLDDSFATVWADIEQRYKTNYLNPQQAAAFGIKKLQDAYDCDLDMTDTVGAIFEGEPDRRMHLIKVIPHFTYRDTSVVPGSMLRPSRAHKRLPDEVTPAHPTKRRRLASQESTRPAPAPAPDLALPSTELHTGLQQPTLDGPYDAPGSDADDVPANGTDDVPAIGADGHPHDPTTHQRLSRSASGTSLLELRRVATGNAPFASTRVKQESPAPAATDAHSLQAALHKSPVSSADVEAAAAPAPAPSASSRRDVYRVPSSPDFMHKKATPNKPAKTYGRSPRSGADLLNMARRLRRSTDNQDTTPHRAPAATTSKARVFQRTRPDHIESTPQEEGGQGKQDEIHATSDDDDDNADLTASFLDDAAETTPNSVQTPARKALVKPVRPGSLKKPSRASLVSTPAGTKRGAKSNAATTPSLKPSAIKSNTKPKTTTTMPANASSKSEKVLGLETMSRMERLEKLLSASQNTPKPQVKTISPAQGGIPTNRDRSDEQGLEIRNPLPVQPTKAPTTPIKSPVPVPTSTRKITPKSSTPSTTVAGTNQPGQDTTFKKPTARVHKSPVSLSSATKASNGTPASTLRRSEVPLPPNVRHLQRNSSLQSSPLANRDGHSNESGLSAPVKSPANISSATPSSRTAPNKAHDLDVSRSVLTAAPTNGAIVISSAESESTTDHSDSGDSRFEEQQRLSKRAVDGAGDAAISSANLQSSVQPEHEKAPSEAVQNNDLAHQALDKPEIQFLDESLEESQTVLPQTQDKPPSGQGSGQVPPWGARSWDFKNLGQANDTNDHTEHSRSEPHAATATAPLSGDEGFAEQESYSTAIEDNVTKSRSASAAASTRSSPAVSRRPARFLSHSPTPDASDSEDDSDEDLAAHSRPPSPQAIDKDVSESEPSSDSSDEEDVEIPDNSRKDALLPSSPPVDILTDSAPLALGTAQPSASQINHATQRTPVPLPAQQQSSQVPRSSQSVSVQAADRRRYTGFRSLREQLADTKAAQATTQKKSFDPRTMSLGKLAKANPLTGFGGNEDESSDEDSSTSSGDSD